MKTDYLDVVQFHASPSRQTLEEHGALDALLELKEAGKSFRSVLGGRA
jgi:aryl-alcohol dehydrogenase-like predicted oxidoreductase